MNTIMPNGVNLRDAIKWISDEIKMFPDKKPILFVNEACMKFNLSPQESEYLTQHFKNAASE